MAAVYTFGSLLQLLGAIITGAGLFYAWNRTSRRFDEWRSSLQSPWEQLRAFMASRGRGMTLEGSGELLVEVGLVGEMELTRGGTVEERLTAGREEVQDLDGRLTKSLSSIPAEIDNAVASEFGRFESLSNAIAVKDIYWALAGIAVGAVGIVVQMCA